MFSLIVIMFIAAVFFIGLFRLLAWMANSFTEALAPDFPQKARTPSNDDGPVSDSHLSKEKEVFKLKVEQLYFEKKITIEEMNKMLDVNNPKEEIKSKPLVDAPIKPVEAPDFFGPMYSKPAPPPPNSPEEKKPDSSSSPAATSSGFFSSTSIKTLLFSGSALILCSAYLFVRSYWTALPDVMKFFGLNIITAFFFFGGHALWRKSKILKTAKAFVFLGLALIPFNAYAANLWMFGNVMNPHAVWAIGFGLLFLSSLLTTSIMPNYLMGFLMGISIIGAAHQESAAFNFTGQFLLVAPSLVFLALTIAVALLKKYEDLKNGISGVVSLGLMVNLIYLISARFYFYETTQIPSIINLAAVGLTFAIHSRITHSGFAYLAGGAFIAATGLLLRELQLPIYQFGYCFIPLGFISLLRAWSFERINKKSLAQPYYLIGQAAIAVSLLCMLPVFKGNLEVNLSSLLLILIPAACAYAVMGAFYRHPFYSYASGVVMLYMAWVFVWHGQMNFPQGILFFSTMASGLLLVGLVGGIFNENQLGQPFIIMGLGTMTLTLALLAGRWGNELLADGTLLGLMPPDQIRAGLWTGALGVFGYGFVAWLKKKAAFIYPAIFSATWVYVCWLQGMEIPFRLFNASWIVAASMILFYIFYGIGYQKAARCFSLWAEMAAIFIAAASLYSNSDMSMVSVLICTMAFLPGLTLGSSDLTIGFLTGVYLTHLLWFRQMMGFSNSSNLPEYALWLVPVNCGIVFIRTLVSRFRPIQTVIPYRLYALAGCLVSLGLSLYNWDIAWQVFLVHGILALLINWIHYENRFVHVGAILIFIAGELFLASKEINYIELYTLPAAIYLLWIGYRFKERGDLRDFFYGFGQVVLYLPSSIEALKETWQWHGIFLGITSLVVMLFGIHQRNRCLTFPSTVVLVGNGFVQSRQYFLMIPRWIYLGLSGFTLVALGGLFEFQREVLINVKNKMAASFEGWD